MNPQHHLDPATLVSFASGALGEAMVAVAATHLVGCRRCRALLRDADDIGGRLLAQQQPDRNRQGRFEVLRKAMSERLDGVPLETSPQPKPENVLSVVPEDHLPEPLHRYFGTTYSGLRWRWVAPGVRLIRADNARAGSLIMLKIAPGKSLPMHGHGGTELTQVLRGAYDDRLGHFAPGDMADLDSEVEHQPVTIPGVPCVCVAALEAPLRFRGWLARKLQPLVGL